MIKPTMFKPVSLLTILALGVMLGACAGTAQPQPTPGPIDPNQAQAFDQAIEHFRQMVQNKPDEIEGALGLARNLRWAGRGEDAAAVLEGAAPRFGDDGRFAAELGKARLLQGRSDEGAELLARASDKIATDWRLYSALGIAHDYQENYPAAQAAYRQALAMCPDDAAVMNNLGISQGLSGHMDRAILTLKDALALRGHTDKIQANLKLFTDARDLCPACGTKYLKASGSMILAAGLMATDREGPCSPHPQYTGDADTMAKQLAQGPAITIKVYFEFDSAILKPEALDALNPLGEALASAKLAGQHFEIAGHTDAVGTDAYNQGLSERRAQTVVDYLVTTFGLDQARMRSIGYGESRLLDPAHPEGDVNRRVQVTRLNPAK